LIKIGDKIIYKLDKPRYDKKLTYNKVYVVVSISNYSIVGVTDNYWVYNNNSILMSVPTGYFINLKEVRKNKLIKLNNVEE